MSSLTVVGGVIEAVGLAVTGWGIGQTWRGSGTRERFVRDSVTYRRGRRVIRRLDARVRRTLRLPTRATPGEVVTGTATIAIDGSADVFWEPHPLDPAMPTAEALALLESRIRKLSERVTRHDKANRDRFGEVKSRANKTDRNIAQLRHELNAAKLDLAVEGLRTEAVGLGLVGLGLLLQTLGA